MHLVIEPKIEKMLSLSKENLASVGTKLNKYPFIIKLGLQKSRKLYSAWWKAVRIIYKVSAKSSKSYRSSANFLIRNLNLKSKARFHTCTVLWNPLQKVYRIFNLLL